MPEKNKPKSPLWRARKQRDIKQKLVASLLGQGSNDQISRYENDARIPSLENALGLEIIYGVPLRVLFADLYERVRDEIMTKITASPSLYAPLKDIGNTEFCSFAALLNLPRPSEGDFAKIRAHVKYMHETFSKRLEESRYSRSDIRE